MKFWLKRMGTAIWAGMLAALAFALVLGLVENFSFDLTGRSLAVGALTAALTFAGTIVTNSVRRLRY